MSTDQKEEQKNTNTTTTTTKSPKIKNKYKYNNGFNNIFETEALPNSLPKCQNNPLHTPYNLYAEQISGTAFTSKRALNKHTWVYRCLPSCNNDTGSLWEKKHNNFGNDNGEDDDVDNDNDNDSLYDPNPLRWFPIKNDLKNISISFLNGIKKYAHSEHNPAVKDGLSIYLYAFQSSIKYTQKECILNSDGDFLIVPQNGKLILQTELGMLDVSPTEIVVIPRGIVFSISCDDKDDDDKDVIASGYILEIYKGHFELPELGPIGSNGLANARDFQYPVAYFDNDNDINNKTINYVTYNKFANSLYCKNQSTISPYNVVSWHGNYSPYKYNLQHFNTMNSVSFDHPDPSIYTVLTAKSDEDGTALVDFVIFPPRWNVSEHTFRPPYYHKNCMTEFMGMIYGTYDAKDASKNGFLPGGASLHSCMTPHGPDYITYANVMKQSKENEDVPIKIDGGLAFMFETNYMLKITKYAYDCNHRDANYVNCWNGFQHSLQKK